MARLSGSILTPRVSKEEAKINLCPLLADSGHSPAWYRAAAIGESGRSELRLLKTHWRAAGKHSKAACQVI
jgi:hypothetical protein